MSSKIYPMTIDGGEQLETVNLEPSLMVGEVPSVVISTDRMSNPVSPLVYLDLSKVFSDSARIAAAAARRAKGGRIKEMGEMRVRMAQPVADQSPVADTDQAGSGIRPPGFMAAGNRPRTADDIRQAMVRTRVRRAAAKAGSVKTNAPTVPAGQTPDRDRAARLTQIQRQAVKDTFRGMEGM